MPSAILSVGMKRLSSIIAIIVIVPTAWHIVRHSWVLLAVYGVEVSNPFTGDVMLGREPSSEHCPIDSEDRKRSPNQDQDEQPSIDDGSSDEDSDDNDDALTC